VPDLAAAISNFIQTTTTLEALLAAVGILSLLTAGVAWVLRMNHRSRKQPAGSRATGRNARGAANGYDSWNVEDGLLFPSGAGGGHSRRERLDRDQFDNGRDAESPSPLSDGFEGIVARSERAIEAVRERPLEFLAGALAAGFAAGLLLPFFSERTRQTRLLERLVESTEDHNLTQAQREAERFRQARQK